MVLTLGQETMSDLLKQELATFEQHREELVSASEGKYALVQGTKIEGVYDTYEDALQIGYGKFGVDTPFLVKRISGIEQISFFTRDLNPCQ